MKYLRLIPLILLLSTINLSLAKQNLPAPQQTPAVPINRIVAVVNETVVTQLDLNNAMRAAREQFQQRGVKIPNNKEFRDKILEGLIYQKLQLQLAEQNKITATEKQVDETIANIAKQNHISVEELKSKLKQQNINYADFRKQLKEQIIITNLQQQAVSGKVTLTQHQVEAFKQSYSKENAVEQYNVIDYLVAFPENPNNQQRQEALRTAEKVFKAVKSGGKIDDQATENDLGWRSIDNIPDAFANYIVHLPDGGVAGPILAGNGYHIIKLVATKRDTNAITDEQARQLLYQKKYQKALEKWLQNLKSSAYIKIYD